MKKNSKINYSIENNRSIASCYLRNNVQFLLEKIGKLYIKKHNIIMKTTKEGINFPDSNLRKKKGI